MGVTRRRLLFPAVSLLLLIGIPSWLTYREVQRAKAGVALIAAIKRHDTPAALAALDSGADPNATEDVRATSFSQVLRDYWNRLRGHKPAMLTKQPTTLLLATGSRKRPDGVGWEPVDIRLVKALAKHGAEVNGRDSNGMTALMNAAYFGPAESVNILLKHGAEVNARDCDGRTALMSAAYIGPVESVKILLEHGAEVNAGESIGGMPLGRTALMYAAEDGKVENVKILLEHGADIHSKDIYGETAMKFAIKKNRPKVIALLKKAGAK